MNMRQSSNLLALSVDVEDGINIAMRDVFDRGMDPTRRVVINTKTILDLLSEYKVSGTFFILGQVAEHYPELVKEIHQNGHEIGVHGYDHYRFNNMSREQAYDQLKRAKELLENLTGKAVKGHRAPAFSINHSTRWGLELLSELGFDYDSSIMPCKAVNYGWEGFSKDICRVRFNEGRELIEVPMSTVSLAGKDQPTLGGSYFRLLPYRFTDYSIKKIAQDRFPIFYMHPYEMDTEKYPDFYFEALKKSSIKTNLLMRSMWVGRSTVKRKLEKLLSKYSFTTIENILLEEVDCDNLPVITIGEEN